MKTHLLNDNGQWKLNNIKMYLQCRKNKINDKSSWLTYNYNYVK